MLLGGKYTASSLQHILTVTDCQYFLRDKDIVLPSFETPAIRFFDVPEEHDLLTCGSAEPYKYEPKFPSALNDPLFVLHTSGSVGKQKVSWYSCCLSFLIDVESPSCIDKAVWRCIVAFLIFLNLRVVRHQYYRKSHHQVDFSLLFLSLTVVVFAVDSSVLCILASPLQL